MRYCDPACALRPNTLDALWHGLDGVVGHTYMQHGFTPHQGFLIHNSPTASLNMWGPDRDIDRVHRLLDATLPPDVIAGILLAADTPDEADTLINYYANDDSPYDDESATRVAKIIDAPEYSRVFGCDCPQPAAATVYKRYSPVVRTGHPAPRRAATPRTVRASVSLSAVWSSAS